MQIERWTNQHHPQTLQIGVFLLYFDAFLSLFDVGRYGILAIVLALGAAAAGVGIANDKKIAWLGGIAVSTISILLLLAEFGGLSFNLQLFISLVFPLAQFAALVHPMSRSYTNTYFQ